MLNQTVVHLINFSAGASTSLSPETLPATIKDQLRQKAGRYQPHKKLAASHDDLGEKPAKDFKGFVSQIVFSKGTKLQTIEWDLK